MVRTLSLKDINLIRNELLKLAKQLRRINKLAKPVESLPIDNILALRAQYQSH